MNAREAGDDSVYIDKYKLLRNLDPWDGDCEIRIDLFYMAGPYQGVSGTYLHNDVEVGDLMDIHYLLLGANPIEDGAVFTLVVTEEDWGSPDDDLGSSTLAWDEDGVWKYFDENNDNDPDFQVMLVW